MAEPQLYRYAGDVCIRLRHFERAIQNYDIDLSSNPSDARVRNMRQQVYQHIMNQKSGK